MPGTERNYFGATWNVLKQREEIEIFWKIQKWKYWNLQFFVWTRCAESMGTVKYFSVNCQGLHLEMTIQFNFLIWEYQVFLQRIASKGSARFCYWGFCLWDPHLFSKNWIKTMDLLPSKLSGIWNVDAFEVPSVEACLKYFVVGKLLLAVTQVFRNSLFPSNLPVNCAGRKQKLVH